MSKRLFVYQAAQHQPGHRDARAAGRPLGVGRRPPKLCAAAIPPPTCWITLHGLRYTRQDRLPLALRQQLDQLAQGSSVDQVVNVLGHRLVGSGRSVLLAWPTGWCRTFSPPSGTWRCRDNYGSSRTTTSCRWTTWSACPRVPRSPRSSSRSSPNATNEGP